MVYGGRTAFEPYEYLDSSGQARGFNVELVRELGRAAGYDVEFRLYEPKTLPRNGTQVGSTSRAESSPTAAPASTTILVQLWTIRVIIAFLPGRGSYPSSLNDLVGETVVLQPRSVVKEELETLPVEGRPTLRLEDDQRESVRLLRRHQVTAVVGNYLTVVRFAREEGLPDLVERPLRTYSYHLVARRGRGAEFAWTFNAMTRVEAAGVRDGLVETHLSLPPPPWSLRNLLPVAGGLLGLVGMGGMLVYVWNRTLRREVLARTEELGSSLLEKEALARYLHLTNETLQAFIQSSPWPSCRSTPMATCATGTLAPSSSSAGRPTRSWAGPCPPAASAARRRRRGS